MKELVDRLLSGTVSRRNFIKGMVALGVTAAYAGEIFDTAVHAATSKVTGRMVKGSGGEVLLETLKDAGIRYIFSANSTGQCPVYDGLVDRPEIRIILATHEAHCISMAQGLELATGEPACAIFPSIGLANAATNIYNAYKDRSSVLCITDGNAHTFAGRDGFDDVDDWEDIVKPITRWRWSLQSANRIPEMVNLALKVSATPPFGPTYVRIPFAVLDEKDLSVIVYPQSAYRIDIKIKPDPKKIEKAAEIILESQNPLITVGREVTRSGAYDDLIKLVDLLGIPVTQGVSPSSDFPTSHPSFVGYYGPGMASHPKGFDLLICLGCRVPDPSFHSPPVRSKIIHAHVEPDIISAYYPSDVAILGDLKETIQALYEAVKDRVTGSAASAVKERMAATQNFLSEEKKKRESAAHQDWGKSPISLHRLAYELERSLDKDAIIVSELMTRLPYEYLSMGQGNKMRIGPSVGLALGWAVGAALGVKLARPDNQVVCLVGDGALLFGQTEVLWSLSRYECPITLVVFNNLSYNSSRDRIFDFGTRQREEKKDMASYLGSPDTDFTKLSAAFSIKGERVLEPGKLEGALKRAKKETANGRPYLLDCRIERTGLGAELENYPETPIAKMRKKSV
jgi:thiamine pyrophosphate-dependent acetolactate synthase large subunit-like protein